MAWLIIILLVATAFALNTRCYLSGADLSRCDHPAGQQVFGHPEPSDSARRYLDRAREPWEEMRKFVAEMCGGGR